MRITLGAVAPRYALLFGLVASAITLTPIVPGGPSWLVLAAAAFVCALPFAIHPLRLRLAAGVRRRVGLTALQDEVDALKLDVARRDDQLAAAGAALQVEFQRGIAEGMQRLAGAALAKHADGTVTGILVVPGDATPSFVGSFAGTGTIRAGARFTLAVIGTGRVLGVIEVTDVTDRGQVVMRCVDAVYRPYWMALNDLSPADMRTLVGVEVVEYHPQHHHSPQEGAE